MRKIIKKKNYIRLGNLDSIESRIQLGFFRCPYCKAYIGVYSDEVSKFSGESFKRIRCSDSTCKFIEEIELEDW